MNEHFARSLGSRVLSLRQSGQLQLGQNELEGDYHSLPHLNNRAYPKLDPSEAAEAA